MKNLKDKKVDIYLMNYETEVREYKATVWAHYRSLSLQESYNAGVDSGVENAYFTISRPDGYELDTWSQIRYNEKIYEVVSIDLFEDKAGSNIRVQARVR